MKNRIYLLIIALCTTLAAGAQSMVQGSGNCGTDVKWSFDGYTLDITNVSKLGVTVNMDNYDLDKHLAPWIKKKFNVRKIRIGTGVSRIGSCAFANCNNLTDVEFHGGYLREIGWGAFYDCGKLRSVKFPNGVTRIEPIAFAGCATLTTLAIPSQCRVEDMAFANCTSLKKLDIHPTASIGHYAFAGEVKQGNNVRHTLANVDILNLPANITLSNCHDVGLNRYCVEKYYDQTKRILAEDVNLATSEVDSLIPSTNIQRQDCYALIIGNQNYRFVPNVPYALHDARVFAEYCKETLGIPAEQVHLCEDATKEMLLGDEFDWLEDIPNRGEKNLIVYYAGHGVPDTKNSNKAYLLPTDVRGTKPQHGISLNDFYSRMGELAFSQTTIFLDACFSGINRTNEAVNEGMRGVEIEAQESQFDGGNIVVFSAAQGNETAQGYLEQGHGLFTYYLLSELQASQGNLNFGMLSDNLNYNVSRKANQLKLRKPQTPTTVASDALSESWRRLTF